MEQHRLIKWLKFLVIFAAGCGMVMDLGVLPGVGSWMVDLAPEFGGYFWPWLIFLWILSVPCYMALWMAWKIFTDIEKDKAFTMENAKRMGNVSFLAAADAVLLVIGNVVYLILHMNHPGVLLASFLVALVGTAIAIAAAMLSHLIRKAARLQDESDWTI